MMKTTVLETLNIAQEINIYLEEHDIQRVYHIGKKQPSKNN